MSHANELVSGVGALGRSRDTFGAASALLIPKTCRQKVSKMTPKWSQIGAWNHTFPELMKPWFCETLPWFYMVFVPPGIQESTEHQKEIAPGKHMPKKSENLGAGSKQRENWSEFFMATGPREFTVFWPGSVLAPFWSPSRFKTSFGCQNDEKMDPRGAQGP